MAELAKTVNCPSEILVGEHNGFLLSLMVLSSYVIQADGRIMHSEMEFMRNFLTEHFGEEKKQKCEQMLIHIFEESKKYDFTTWTGKIAHCARQMNELMDEEQRVLLLAFLIKIVRADGIVETSETSTISLIAHWLEIDVQAANDIEDLRKEVAEL